jgi:hypothetical protein
MRAPAGLTVEQTLAMAADEHTPPEALAQLAEDDRWEVRCNVAYNRAAPPEVLGRLAGDSRSRVRVFVAHNPRCPGKLLRQLARDPYTMRWVVSNPSCPPDVLADIWSAGREQLAQHKVEIDRYEPANAALAATAETFCVVAHPGCPAETLRSVLSDEQTRQWDIPSALQSIDAPQSWPVLRAHLLVEFDVTVERTVAAHPNCPPDILVELIYSDQELVQLEAAANPGLPQHVLAMWQLTH